MVGNKPHHYFIGGDSMLLDQFNQFYDIVAKHDPECIAFNDHHANIVIQFNTGDIEEILKEIKNILPAGMSIGWTYEADAYEITFYEGGDTMKREYEQQANIVDASIQSEFGPLDWIDQTLHEDSKYSISFMGPRIEDNETCMSAGFRGREDGFFAKMRRIKEMIHNCGYNAELIKFEADKDHPYSEATINLKLDGSEL